MITQIDYVSEALTQRLLTCEYNEANQLIRCHSHQFGDIYHDYDASGFMQSWRDTQKTHTQIQYDEKGRVLATKTASGHYADRFDYDETNRCNTYFDAEGGVSRYWYNQDNLVTKIEDALGRLTETKWRFSQKVEERDALGRKVSYVYNENGCLTEIHSPLGESHYRYNKFGQIIEAVNPQGEKWQYQYCDKGGLIAAISPAGLMWDYHRDEKGRVNRISYPDGNYTIYGYDETKGQLQSVYNTRGERTSFEMDIFARPRWLTQADGSTYHYEYSQAHANPKGSLTKLTTPEGSIQQFGYNSERLVTEAIDGNGNRTRYGYGAFDLLEWQETPQGERLHFGYDKLTRLTQVKNAQGDVYRYDYDKAGQLIAETDFAGNHKTYAYDAAGRLVRQSQAGRVETFCYDEEDKLLCRQSWQMGEEQAVKNAEDFAKQRHYVAVAQSPKID